MYVIGEEEIEAVARVINSGDMFRYGEGGQCDLFEKRYAEFVGVEHVALTASGTNAVAAAVIALGIGPGDEVIVPAHTYMATALAVLAAGAIPVIVDVDESITIDPDAIDSAVGPHTKAVIPVHMWGATCDMDRIMEVAARHGLKVIEDCCQCVGGSYKGRKVGSFGDINAFSFNFYKNMSCGEGGAVATDDDTLIQRAKCVIDPCHFYWTGREDFKPFASNGARPNEFQGAILNAQLDRIDGIVEALRSEKKQALTGTSHLAELGLRPTPMNSADHECGAHAMYLLPKAEDADVFKEIMPCVIAGKTGRHNYVEWDQILMRQGAAHPLMNPYEMEANKVCRQEYDKEMCASSLDILNRTIMISMSPKHSRAQTDQLIRNIDAAARATFGQVSPDEVEIVDLDKVDEVKFDMVETSS